MAFEQMIERRAAAFAGVRALGMHDVMIPEQSKRFSAPTLMLARGMSQASR